MNSKRPASTTKTDGTLASMGQVLYRLIEIHGIDAQGFMKAVGINPDVFRDPTARVPERLLEKMAEHCLGVHQLHRGKMFYFNFAVLIELTEGLEELSKDYETLREAHVWLAGNGAGQSEVDIKKRCDAGLDAFTKFKKVLSARGLLALPSRVK